MHACVQTQRVRGAEVRLALTPGDQEGGPLHQRDQVTVGTSRDQGLVLGGTGYPESCLVHLFFLFRGSSNCLVERPFSQRLHEGCGAKAQGLSSRYE